MPKLILDQGLNVVREIERHQKTPQAIMIVIYDCVFDFPVFIGL